jgi:hypothetical protein
MASLTRSNPSKVKMFFGSSVLLVLVGGIGYPYFSTYRSREAYKAVRSEYLAGHLGMIPGPYVSFGDAKKLRFKVIDLGASDTASISENGEVLYRSIQHWTGPDHKRGPDYNRLRHRDGKVEVLDEVYDYALTPSGHLAYSQGDRNNSNRKLFLDGKPILELTGKEDITSPAFHIYSSELNVTDDGFFDRCSYQDGQDGGSTFSFVSPDGIIRTVPSRFDTKFEPNSSSSELGSVKVFREESFLGGERWFIEAFRRGQFHRIEFPIPGVLSGCGVCKDALFTGAPINAFQSAPMKLVYGTYERVPVPPNSYTAGVCAASTADRYVISASFLKSIDFGHGMKVADGDHRYYLVERNVAYDLRDIYRLVGIDERSELGDHMRGRPISADGDMIITDRQGRIPHMYLLLRQ